MQTSLGFTSLLSTRFKIRASSNEIVLTCDFQDLPWYMITNLHIEYLNRPLLSNSEINGLYLWKQPVCLLENTCVLVAQLLAINGVLQNKGGKYEYILHTHRYRK